jgi:hypothetical protein
LLAVIRPCFQRRTSIPALFQGTFVRLSYQITPRKVALLLAAFAVYFALQSLVADYLVEVVLDKDAYPYAVYAIDLFSANAEQTFPTWYSALLLLTASILLSLITVAGRKSGRPDTLLWGGLALVFLYLSLDEVLSIHEIAAEWLQTDFEFTGFFAFGWQIAAAPFLVLFAVLYFRFWLRLPARTRLLFMLAGIVYVGGAFVIEGVSAAYWDSTGGISYPYLVIATLEEFCEMIGVIVLIYALLNYMAIQGDTLEVSPISALQPARLTFRSPFRVLLAIGLIAVVNLAVVSWAASAVGTEGQDTEGQYIYQSLVDQLAVEGVIVARVNGQFGFGVPPGEIITALAERFPSVMVVNLVSSNSHLILAGDPLPHIYDGLVEILHSNGETQFMILDDSAVRFMLQAAASE